MMVPTWQTCPICRDQFKGSDMVGDPCPSCTGIGAIDHAILVNALNQMYYLEENEDDRSAAS